MASTDTVIYSSNPLDARITNTKVFFSCFILQVSAIHILRLAHEDAWPRLVILSRPVLSNLRQSKHNIMTFWRWTRVFLLEGELHHFMWSHKHNVINVNSSSDFSLIFNSSRSSSSQWRLVLPVYRVYRVK